MNPDYKIIVIGGGASGMAAAISAARLTDGVCIAEAQPRPGRKLLATGNGRCNITNSFAAPDSYRTGCPEAVRAVFDRIPPDAVRSFLRSVGLELSCEDDGRMYPRSSQASSVLDMLRFELERLNVEIKCDAGIDSVRKQNGCFTVSGSGITLSTGKVIFACGSKAAPQLGGSDSGVRLLRALGHSAAPLRPALVPLRCDSPVIRSLKGIRVRCKASAICKGKEIYSDTGEVQFADGALSGIVIFQLSSRMAEYGGQGEIRLDLMPETSEQELREMLMNRRKALGHLTLETFLSGLLNKRIGICIMKASTSLPLTENASELTDSHLYAVAKLVKSWSFTVSGAAPWQQAQVMSGGIRLDEFDHSLCSLRSPGIYACGELLDCDGDCGGYNLHWAWASGILAGQCAAGMSHTAI